MDTYEYIRRQEIAHTIVFDVSTFKFPNHECLLQHNHNGWRDEDFCSTKVKPYELVVDWHSYNSGFSWSMNWELEVESKYSDAALTYTDGMLVRLPDWLNKFITGAPPK